MASSLQLYLNTTTTIWFFLVDAFFLHDWAMFASSSKCQRKQSIHQSNRYRRLEHFDYLSPWSDSTKYTWVKQFPPKGSLFLLYFQIIFLWVDGEMSRGKRRVWRTRRDVTGSETVQEDFMFWTVLANEHHEHREHHGVYSIYLPTTVFAIKTSTSSWLLPAIHLPLLWHAKT